MNNSLSVLCRYVRQLINWRYFFKGSVLTKLNNQEESVEHEQQFVSIMQVCMTGEYLAVLLQMVSADKIEQSRRVSGT